MTPFVGVVKGGRRQIAAPSWRRAGRGGERSSQQPRNRKRELVQGNSRSGKVQPGRGEAQGVREGPRET